MKNIIIYEDSNFENLAPFSINHASFELKCGIFSNLDRIIKHYNNAKIILIVRDELKDLINERYPDYEINPKKIPPGICINGALIFDKNTIDISFQKPLKHKEKIVGFNLIDELDIHEFQNYLQKITKGIEKDILCVNYLWECIDLFHCIMKLDMAYYIDKDQLIKSKDVFYINEKNIYINNSANIEPGCIIDATNGPIVVNKNVIIQSGSIIKGPTFIDVNSTISNGAKLKGNVLIGKTCKVGGEITDTIFHGYSNKVHDGFLGHSYVGEWVNLGANTNNSNLKNNYSTIKFKFANKSLDTNRTFLGVMIGDFTRTGISTMINTGSYFGLGANIFGGGFQNKFIDSFAWGKKSKVDFNKFIDTLKIMKKRRSKKLTKTEVKFLKNLYDKINL
tara:strand:+ start:74 stop:1252 length:1179 start_codon:yes stop_codon:yes gene_type:complete